MISSRIGLLAIATFFVWTVLGIVWLRPKRLAILKRVGRSATNDDLIRLAKAGDVEAQVLRKLTWYYMGLGAMLSVLLLLVGIIDLRT